MSEDTPVYYTMSPGTDVFSWASRLPFPEALRTAPDAVGLFGCWFTAVRYAVRCLWKAKDREAMARDAEKAAVCFQRLAALLRTPADEHLLS